MAQNLAMNPRAPLPVLLTFVKRRSEHAVSVQRNAANQLAERTPASLWHFPREPLLVLAARLNQPRCPRYVRVLGHVRRDSPDIARALAGGPKLSNFSRQVLAKHNRWDVRAVLAGRPDLTNGDYRRLKKSPDWAVLDALARNHVLTARQIEQIRVIHPAITLTKVQHPNCPAVILEYAIAASHIDPYIRAVALRHPTIDTLTLKTAAEDLQAPAWVLRSIALNPACPTDVRDGLLAWIAVGGAGFSDPMFDPVTGMGHPGDTRTDRSVALTELADLYSRVALFRLAWVRAQSTVQLPDLRRLSRDPDPAIRQRAAQFNNRAEIEVLVTDANEVVVMQAVGMLPTLPKVSRWKRSIGVARPDKSRWPLLVPVLSSLIFGSFSALRNVNSSTPRPTPTLIPSAMNAPFRQAPQPSISIEIPSDVTVQTANTTVICITPAIEVQLMSAGKTNVTLRVLATTDVPVTVIDAFVVGPATATPDKPVVAGVRVTGGRARLKLSTPEVLSTVSFDVDPSALTIKGTCS